jgi:energy-coupling factor transporter ATP-binding protein EcfA2
MKHKIILLSGKQGSGKSTLADGLEIMAREHGYEPMRTRFAKILYEMHDAAIAVAKKYGIKAGPKEGEMLQWIGTEWGRMLKGENVWVNALKNYVEQEIANAEDPIYIAGRFPTSPDWQPKLCFVIDDMRFVNEFEAFGGDGILKIRLEADREVRKARCSYWRENETHISETGLDHLIMADAGSGFDAIVRSDLMDTQQVLDFVTKAAFK